MWVIVGGLVFVLLFFGVRFVYVLFVGFGVVCFLILKFCVFFRYIGR